MQNGTMQTMYNEGVANYLPNTLGGGMPQPAPEIGKRPEEFVTGNVARSEITGDDYYQAGCRYRMMSVLEKKHLVSNIVENLSQAYEPIQRRMIEHFMQVDHELGSRIARGINLNI
ncbi:catalase-related domain-containing protein [Pelosinus propionicus]